MVRDYFGEMEVHPGTQVLREWTGLNRSLYGVKRNREALVSLLIDTEENRKRWIGSIEDKSGRSLHDLFDELYCALLNYLSATGALVDHTRRHVDYHYKGTDFADEYQKRIRAIAVDPSRPFLQGLRNLMLHRGNLPLVGRYIARAEPRSETLAIKLSSEKLLEQFSWNSEMKAFICQSDEVDLLSAVNDYSMLIGDLYGWMFSQWRELHAEELESMHKLNDEFKRFAKLSLKDNGLLFRPQLDEIHV